MKKAKSFYSIYLKRHLRPRTSPRARTIVTERWPYMDAMLVRHNPEDPRSTACAAQIRLDRVTYACTRTQHAGAHDAGAKHADGGWVRW